MAEFAVNTDALRMEADSLRSLQRELDSVAMRLSSLQISRVLRSSSAEALNIRIRDCREAVSNQSMNLGALFGGLNAIAGLYDSVEKNLSDPKASDRLGNGGAADGILDWFSDIDEWIRPDIVRWDLLVLLLLGPGAVLGGIAGAVLGGSSGTVTGSATSDNRTSVFSGGISGSGNAWGVPCAGALGYSLLGYDTDTIAKASWNLEKGNAGLKYGGKFSVYGAQGSASGNFGVLGGSAQGSVGNAAVSGTVNATLFENGHFTPSIGLEAKAEASVLKGKAEGYVGSKDNNVHVKGRGTVLGAEAKAEGKLGVITTTDPKTGEKVTSYGVKGTAAAEAYLAEGRVSGGVTIFGIDIDVGVSGKAGGAGVKVGGSVTTNGISGEVGAGLGLGAGVEVSVDWSDFDPPSLADIGEGLANAGEAIGEGLENAGEAIGNGLERAGEAVSDFFNW